MTSNISLAQIKTLLTKLTTADKAELVGWLEQTIRAEQIQAKMRRVYEQRHWADLGPDPYVEPFVKQNDDEMYSPSGEFSIVLDDCDEFDEAAKQDWAEELRAAWSAMWGGEPCWDDDF